MSQKIDLLVNENVMGYAGGDLWPVPPYSTSIAAAWPVWIKISNQKREDWDEPQDWAIEVYGDGKARIFAYEFDLYETTIIESDTAPMAICLAALRAVGIEVGVIA